MRRAPPATCIWATCAPRCLRGFSPATVAGPSTCASTTSTPSAPQRNPPAGSSRTSQHLESPTTSRSSTNATASTTTRLPCRSSLTRGESTSATAPARTSRKPPAPHMPPQGPTPGPAGTSARRNEPRAGRSSPRRAVVQRCGCASVTFLPSTLPRPAWSPPTRSPKASRPGRRWAATSWKKGPLPARWTTWCCGAAGTPRSWTAANMRTTWPSWWTMHSRG